MIKIIDRQMVRGFFKAYFVCLTSLLCLYIVVDLFTNLDDFAQNDKGLGAVVRKIFTFYGYQVWQIFDRLCEAIVLLAAMFTVAWMQRNNEQVPLLSAGMSTRRIVMPVLASGAIMLSLAVLNQELLLPRIAHRLSYAKDDPGGERELAVKGAYDSNGVHVEGDRASRKQRRVHPFRCTIPEKLAGNLLHLTAEEAYYTATGPRAGYWELTGTHPADVGWSDPKVLEQVDSGRYCLHTRDVDFDALTRETNWYILASTSRLYQELQKPESNRLAAMAVLFHGRLVRPVLGLLLVVMGLSVILRDQNRNVIISSGMCLVLCGMFFAASYSCKMLGENDILSPVMAAWMPVIFFGPFAMVLFEAVHT